MIVNPHEEADQLKTEYWEPNHKQFDFARIPYSVFEAFYGGALGGGKSELLLMLPVVYRMHEHPRFHGIFFRRTLSQQDESLVVRAKYLYGKVGGVYNEQKRIFTFPSGAILRFTYLERDEHARDHDGAEYHYVAFDELTHFSKFQYLYITTRIRRATGELPVIIRCASNPGNIGHAWVRERFIDPCREGGKILRDKAGNKRIFIKSLLKDNPYITKEDPDYINRLQITKELDEAEYRAKVEGDWYVFSGQVFTEFRDIKRDGEPDNALHVIEPFKIPYYYPRIYGLDWGYAANTYLLEGSISPDKRVILSDEYIINKTTISKWSREIGGLIVKNVDGNLDAVKSILVDPSSRKKDGQQEKSIFEQIQEGLGEELGQKLEFADNDRLSGKQTIHELLRWKQLPKVKHIKGEFSQTLFDSLYRNMSPQTARLYYESFQQESDELFIPRLQIFNTCKEIINVIPLCIYNEQKGTSRKNKKYEDVAEWDGDDPYDTLRYLAKGVDRYVSEVIGIRNELNKIEKIHQKLAETGNQHNYYMAMRLLQEEKKRQGNSNSIPRTRGSAFRRRR